MHERGRRARAAVGAKALTAVGRLRTGDGRSRTAQREWARTGGRAASFGGGGSGYGGGARSGAPNGADLALDQQAAALGLYA